jgi:hypothetical protein
MPNFNLFKILFNLALNLQFIKVYYLKESLFQYLITFLIRIIYEILVFNHSLT